ncbi:hypothetical protein HX882_13185 [Pseudomonas gingeri]|uniref:Uncharacterized protein n=1 Tax=Pseudomonas gingeri TaxID=117681 RepID=A0A7Y7XBU5_9PSED|nr:hypothetical protein [Pseudomonas gingeri]NWB96851.1 hypothetical protein [Pseudomonas gingeri]
MENKIARTIPPANKRSNRGHLAIALKTPHNDIESKNRIAAILRTRSYCRAPFIDGEIKYQTHKGIIKIKQALTNAVIVFFHHGTSLLAKKRNSF